MKKTVHQNGRRNRCIVGTLVHRVPSPENEEKSKCINNLLDVILELRDDQSSTAFAPRSKENYMVVKCEEVKGHHPPRRGRRKK